MEQKAEKVNSSDLKAVKTCLNPDFDRLPPEQIYVGYEMEVPEEVMEFSKLVVSLGGRVLLVGGCVRDAIISKEKGEGKIVPKDIDMEVYGIYPKDLMRLVKLSFDFKEDKTVGNKFELITVNSRNGSLKFDVSIAREDNKTGVGNKGFETHSHPEFSILEGARRRDLTCNSMAYDPLTKITYDPFKGRQDILDGTLRATDDEKFIEDPVRILRLMRFGARYGWEVAPETEALCAWMMDKEEMAKRRVERYEKAQGTGKFAVADEILEKSAIELDDEVKERVWAEFVKMFKEGGKPSIGLDFIRRVGVIDRYFPWLAELTVTEQENEWHPEGNTWKHTMQVIDAAVEISKRENLNNLETLELIAASLSHDLGKPTKTEKKFKKDKNGIKREVITSDGHDMEGGWLSTEFINAFAPVATLKMVRDENDDYIGHEDLGFEKELKARVRILTEKHMQIKAWYLDYLALKDSNPEKAEKRARKSLGKLARELAERGTNIFMLSYVTEADQRGRNGNTDEPLKRDEVEQLEDWQNWLREMMAEVEIKKTLPAKIVNGERIKAITGLGDGVELGVISSWIFDDQLAGEFASIEEGMERAKKYKEVLVGCMQVAREENWRTVNAERKKKPPKLEDEVCRWLKDDGVKEMVMENVRLGVLRKIVERESGRVAELGKWPRQIKAEALIERVPKGNEVKSPGFDAGVACALNLIPRDKQELAAKLHANYSEETIEQVRNELAVNDPNSPTTWWLAACAICKEGEVNGKDFLQQVEDFKILAANSDKRLVVAEAEFNKMKRSFEVIDGVAFGNKDGCMQAAYLAGYPVAVMYAKNYGVYFVGTYLPSLGLERFDWSTETDEGGNPKSGPVHESKQFVKCASEEELMMVLETIKKLINPPV